MNPNDEFLEFNKNLGGIKKWKLTYHLGDKKVNFFLLLYKYFNRTCTQTRGDNIENCLNKKGFKGMLNIFYILSEISFKGGGQPLPPWYVP